MICDFHIPFFNTVFKKCVFICMKRDIDNNIRSLYDARIRQYGDEKHWYSFKTPNYNELIKINDPYDQIRAQVLTIHEGINNGLSSVPDKKKMLVKYEDFCKNPKKIYNDLSHKLASQEYDIGKYNGVSSFDAR